MRFDFVNKETGKVLGHADSLSERVRKANMKRYKNCAIVERADSVPHKAEYNAILADNSPKVTNWHKGKQSEEYANFTDALAKLRTDGGTLEYKL